MLLSGSAATSIWPARMASIIWLRRSGAADFHQSSNTAMLSAVQTKRSPGGAVRVAKRRVQRDVQVAALQIGEHGRMIRESEIGVREVHDGDLADGHLRRAGKDGAAQHHK